MEGLTGKGGAGGEAYTAGRSRFNFNCCDAAHPVFTAA